jgi:glutamate synthase (NADPH/NADH) small chain
LVLVAFLRDQTGKLHGIRLSRAVSGRPVGGTEHDMPCDLAVIAIGQSKLGALVDQCPGVEVDARGCIVASASTGATGNPRVFSGGDCANGGKEVVHAVADGRNAAREMVRGWRAN